MTHTKSLLTIPLLVVFLAACGTKAPNTESEQSSGSSMLPSTPSGGGNPPPATGGDSRGTPTPTPSPTPGPPAGWTTFTPSIDTQITYVVSSSPGTCQPYTASDPAIGPDPRNPIGPLTQTCGTIAEAIGKLRNGYPDWLLLKKGGVWDTTFYNSSEANGWMKAGRSDAERMVIASYGAGARPLIRTGNAGALITGWNTNPSNLAFVGLHFLPHQRNPSTDIVGINWIQHTSNVLFEDNRVERYSTNMVIQAFCNGPDQQVNPCRQTNIRLNRNVVLDAFNDHPWQGPPYPQGTFIWGVDGITMEGNIFDHNGWLEGGVITWFLKNFYVANTNTNVVLRENIISGTDGAQMRSGGFVENNLFLRNASTLMFGCGNDAEPGGVSGTIRANVALDARNTGDNVGNPIGGGGIGRMGNITSLTMEYNIYAHNVHGSAPALFYFTNGTEHNSAGPLRGVQNAFIHHNIYYNWGGGFEFVRPANAPDGTPETFNIVFADNIVQNISSPYVNAPLINHFSASTANPAVVTSADNEFYRQVAEPWMQVAGSGRTLTQWQALVGDTSSVAQQHTFTNPNADISSYSTSVGGAGTYEDFITRARQQSKDNWNPAYTADAVNTYIRAAYDLALP